MDVMQIIAELHVDMAEINYELAQWRLNIARMRRLTCSDGA
jgi:hypothetical protein